MSDDIVIKARWVRDSIHGEHALQVNCIPLARAWKLCGIRHYYSTIVFENEDGQIDCDTVGPFGTLKEAKAFVEDKLGADRRTAR